MLLRRENAKPGQVYGAVVGESSRYLQVLQLLKRGEDYARVAFAWVAKPKR